MSLAGKHILLGITGGIAAYKTPELVRQLTARGAVVQVVMTRGAHQFVTPIALQAVSGRAVRTDLWDASAEAAMGHIELARWAHCIVIAPATAHCLARLAYGAADDLLTTVCLAASCPIAVAPAMNHLMWQHPATRRNVVQLVRDGILIWGPAEGPQACGEYGPGRMLEPEELCVATERLFGPKPLAGKRFLVTAGPTREPLDPVRYISNASSGKQGFSLARAAAEGGAVVTLVAGPVTLDTPPGVRRIDVVTTRQMSDAVNANLDGCDVFIGVAAVADYRPTEPKLEKIKKSGDAPLSLELVQNPDIIATVARSVARPFVVGFAAETHDGIDNARTKLSRKGLDMIVLNDVSDSRIGFDSDNNAVTIITADSEESLAMSSKAEISRLLVQRITQALSLRNTNRRARVDTSSTPSPRER